MIESMSIGVAAREAGVGVETIRFYQRRGLIDEPAKPFRGVRRYPPDVVNRIRFIKRAQVLGFSLDEIVVLQRLELAGACAETRDLAIAKLEIIESKISDLSRLRDSLASLVSRCDQEGSDAGCPIIESLAKDEQTQVPERATDPPSRRRRPTRGR